MKRLYGISVLLIVTCAAFTQTADHSLPSGGGHTVWEPPAWNFLTALPNSTVPKEMLATLRVSGLPISLEETRMDDARNHLGGTIGRKGDAGDFLEWLCLHHSDSRGRWVLWLESGEIDGGTVGSFQWQRLDKDGLLDQRCQMLQGAGSGIKLPISLQLGMTETEVLKTLGAPTTRHGNRLIYVHEHQESIRGEPFTSTNIVSILLRGGMVWAIDVSKTTTS
ncbi:MAG: hypothetical protein WB421_05565 [Terriglobales bacterium]